MLTAQLTNFRNTTNKWLTNIKKKSNARSPKLLYFHTYIAGKQITGQQFVGQQTIPLAQIRGSLDPGRCRDFDGNFRLLNKQGQERLDGVARAWQRKSLPPISLIQVGDIYFVQDGHHRVSISITNKQEQIMAKVTVIQVEGNVSTSVQLAYA